VYLADRCGEMSWATTNLACVLCLRETHTVVRQQGFTHASAVNVVVVPVWSCCSTPAMLCIIQHHLLSRNAVVCLLCCALCERYAVQREP